VYWRRVTLKQWLLWLDEQSAERGQPALRAVIARNPYIEEPEGTKYVASGGRRQSVHTSLEAAQRAAERSAEEQVTG
jgi:hypothetical protein